MKKALPLFAIALFMFASCADAASPAAEGKSGLQVGSRVPAYHVNDCTGPRAGKNLCYRCAYGKRPVVNIFARDVTPEVASLIVAIDKKVAANKDSKMAAFVVHLTDDTDASEKTLKAVAKKNSIKNTPLTNFEGVAGPSSYKIAKGSEVTIMMWVNSKVKVNHSLAAKDLTKEKIAAIIKDTSKILN